MVKMEIKVQEDIDNCENVLNSGNIDEAKELYEDIISAYGVYIDNFDEGLDDPSMAQWAKREADYIGNIRKLKKKLELFQANDCIPTATFRQGSMSNSVNLNNDNSSNNSSNNSNTNTNSITNNLETLFEETKKDIQDNGYLSPEEIEEILKKINEVKKIHTSRENKNSKWQKLKEIVSWTANKGIVVAASVLNLITAVLKASC